MHACLVLTDAQYSISLNCARLNEKSVLEEPIINEIARQHSATAAQVLLVSQVVARQFRIEFCRAGVGNRSRDVTHPQGFIGTLWASDSGNVEVG